MEIDQANRHPVLRYIVAPLLLLIDLVIFVYGAWIYHAIYQISVADELLSRYVIQYSYGPDWESRWIEEAALVLVVTVQFLLAGIVLFNAIRYLGLQIYHGKWLTSQFGYRNICIRSAILFCLSIGLILVGEHMEHFGTVRFSSFATLLLLVFITMPILLLEAYLHLRRRRLPS